MIWGTFSNICYLIEYILGQLFQDIAHFILGYIFPTAFQEFFIHSGYQPCVGYKSLQIFFHWAFFLAVLLLHKWRFQI